MEADQPAQATARRYHLVMAAWRNAGDDQTAQRLANRLAESWFGCSCEVLASRQPPPESLADLPWSVQVMEAEQPSPVAALQSVEKLADAIQSFFLKLRQVPDMPGRQVSQATRPIPKATGKP